MNPRTRLLGTRIVLLALSGSLLSQPSVRAQDWDETSELGTGRWLHSSTLLPTGEVLVAGGMETGVLTSTLASVEIFSPATAFTPVGWTAAASMTTPRDSHTATLLHNGRVLVVGGRNASVALATAELYDPIAGTWTPTGSLGVARRNHTATLLPDGHVLVSGGTNAGSPAIGTAELYDPATGTWTSGGTMRAARQAHAATLLSDGRVLLTGGSAAGPVFLASAEVFAPGTGVWSDALPMAAGRAAHTATRLADGRVLVAGGLGAGTLLNTSELFDPSTGAWTATSNVLSTARSIHTASLLPDGRVLVTGGVGPGAVATATAERFDPTTRLWSTVPGMDDPRIGASATLLASGKILVAGGASTTGLDTAELYDPATPSWTVTGATGRAGHTQTLLLTGEVLIAGGDNVTGTSTTRLASAQRRDPTTGAWNPTGSLQQARAFHTATLLVDGRVLVVGGRETGGTRSATAEIFDPGTGSWTGAGTLSAARSDHTATLLPDGRVLVAGGIAPGAPPTAEVFDPTASVWASAGSMVASREYHTATLLTDGQVLVAGGFDAALGSVTGSTELYDPPTGVWTLTGGLTTPRGLHTATLLPNGEIVVVGGSGAVGAVLAGAEVYDPTAGTWSAPGDIRTARTFHTATLLPSGHVVIAGGVGVGGTILDEVELFDPATREGPEDLLDLSNARFAHTAGLLADGTPILVSGRDLLVSVTSAERLDPGLGFDAAWQPSIATHSAPVLGQPLTLTGTRFQGVSEASGGNTYESASNYPLVQLYRLDNGQIVFVPPSMSSWSDTSVATVPLSGIQPGPALLTVFTNGIPSPSRLVSVKAMTSTSITTHTPNPSVVGQSFTVSYAVSSPSGTPGGTVTVSGAGLTCTGPAPTGSCALTPTTTGTFTLTAAYAGGGTFAASAGVTPHTVNPASTTTAITAHLPNPSVAGGGGFLGSARTASHTVTAPAPSLTIASPAAASVTATSPFLELAGTASVSPFARPEDRSDPPGAAVITAVTWESDRGGSGTAEGTTSWRVRHVPLQAGLNRITVKATDSNGLTASESVDATVSQLLYYLAEGATGPFFDLDLLLGNPNGVPAPVTVTYLREDGSTVPQALTLAAMSERTIRVNDIPGLATGAVSTIVSSDSGLPLVVERSMLWDAGAPPRLGQADAPALTPGATYYGGHTAKAVSSPQTQWLFAEGSQGFFDTYLLLANANATSSAATVTYLVEGGPPVVQNVSVGATSRLTLFAGAVSGLVGKSFGIKVSSSLPLIAERAMYFSSGRFWEGGHESAGVPDAATSWFHAEGATGTFFDTYLLVSNPNGVPANLTVTYLLDTGGSIVRSYGVPANGRITINVETQDPQLASAAVSTTVASDVPVISERAMYWTGGFTTWYEAHNSFGVTATGTKWGLAEGRVGAPHGYETFILLANPSAASANVQITYLRTSGAPVVKAYVVPPTSRFNVWVNVEVPELADESFGAVVEVTNGTEIAVERALYWNAPTQSWTGGTNATATRLP